MKKKRNCKSVIKRSVFWAIFCLNVCVSIFANGKIENSINSIEENEIIKKAKAITEKINTQKSENQNSEENIEEKINENENTTNTINEKQSKIQINKKNAEKNITPNGNLQKHEVEIADSKCGNPLKGLFAFENTQNMSVSMEYFALPVNAVQKGMNEFDWSEFEKRLSAVSKNGNQAVVRFYYDTPGQKSGVPDFVIKNGLKMREYKDEKNQLGAGGVCPDYKNEYFRKSMQNFISEFGKKYDGDGRIGFITLGLLGFWGEWHNWPYDEEKKTADFFAIPTEVQKEVLDAFDKAFNITKLCVREPKENIDFSKYDIGFHDDSFAYATLSQKHGGKDWHFMQRLVDANVSETWKKSCIGGEIYPPIQNVLFAKNKGNFQNWDLCVKETHASWMLCNKILNYKGEELEKAKKVSTQLGYDLRILNVFYNGIELGKDFVFQAEIENIGIAPFYYDKRTWPVLLGIKNEKNIVLEYKTDWDLCDIEAGQKILFETCLQNISLQKGEYEICLKVKNPIPNGKNLWFANKNQTPDGWLNVGKICVR